MRDSVIQFFDLLAVVDHHHSQILPASPQVCVEAHRARSSRALLSLIQDVLRSLIRSIRVGFIGGLSTIFR